MNLHEYSAKLGTLLGNFHSLEFALRAFLYQQNDAPHNPFPPNVNLTRLTLGDVVPVNAMTSYDSLGELIARYNRRVSDRPELMIDEKIVELRDALAHGRVSTSSPSSTLTLLKFTRPKNDQTRVCYCAELTDEWLRKQVHGVFEELQKVVKAGGPSFSA